MYNNEMVELKTSEQLLYFMIHNLRLSRYDSRFLQNLEKIIVVHNRITTNQVSLVEKLILKYERQFVKHEMFVKDLMALTWNTTVVQTTEEYTSAHIGIVDDNLILKSPYNKQFINGFRSVCEDSFIWDPTNKYYIGELSTHSLKLLINTTTKYYSAVRYGDNVTKLLAQLDQYKSAKYWKPTLVCCNGNYMIACTNDALNNALANIPLNKELTTLAELARYGVDIDESILVSDEERFASQLNPEVELANINNIIPWLQKINCDYVYISGSGLTSSLLNRKDFVQQLNTAGIKYSDTSRFHRNTHYKFPVAIRFRLIPDFNEPANVGKIVNIVNSQPINLEKNETM